MVVMIILLMICVIVKGEDINLEDVTKCSTEHELNLVDVDHVSFLTAPGYLVKLQIYPQEQVYADISLRDPSSRRVTYFSTYLDKSEDNIIYSLNNQLELDYVFTDAPTTTDPNASTASSTTTTSSTSTTTTDPNALDCNTLCLSNENVGGGCCLPSFCFCTIAGAGVELTCGAEQLFCIDNCIAEDKCIADSACCSENKKADEDVCSFCVENELSGLYGLEDDCCGSEFCYCDRSGGYLEKCKSGHTFCQSQGLCIPSSSCNDIECCPELTNQSKRQKSKSYRGLNLIYSCQPPGGSVHENIVFGSGSADEPLEPNSIHTYSLESDNIHNIEINLDTPSPIAGFAAVSLGNGKWAIGFRSLNLSIFSQHENISNVQIVTANKFMGQSSSVQLDYDLGEEVIATPTTTTTTTTPTAPPDQIITVFVLVINELQFVQNNLGSLKIRTWNIITEACPSLVNSDNLIRYTPTDDAYSCRKSCYLSDNPDRGCAMVMMDLLNVPESIHCPLIVGMSREDYFRAELKVQEYEMKVEYSAKRVDIDSCTAITWKTDWVWVCVGAVSGSLLLSATIMLFKKSTVFKRVKRSSPAKEDMGDVGHVNKGFVSEKNRRSHFIVEEDDYQD